MPGLMGQVIPLSGVVHALGLGMAKGTGILAMMPCTTEVASVTTALVMKSKATLALVPLWMGHTGTFSHPGTLTFFNAPGGDPQSFHATPIPCEMQVAAITRHIT